MDWDNLSLHMKMIILSEESTVLVGLLAENSDLIEMVRSGASREACLKFINENW
jgi:hypothetical protein